MDYKRHFEGFSREELLEYLEFLLHNYRVMDAFWFLNVEERHGHAEACKINELVWGKTAQLAARDLKKRFKLDQGGLEGFLQAQRLFPWAILVGYRFQEGDGEVTLTVPDCPAQTARLRRGLGEYDCKEMHVAEFGEFAREIDPAIRVECLYAPPDPHPEDHFCKWRFTLERD
jgi:hypothetical protein